VTPFFTEAELAVRPTEFDRSHAIGTDRRRRSGRGERTHPAGPLVFYWGGEGGADRFVYETPYTEGSGKTHGTVATQRKRLTVLTTEQPFPSLLRRLPVVKQEEVRAPSPASCT
jgi:hypothetical protein